MEKETKMNTRINRKSKNVSRRIAAFFAALILVNFCAFSGGHSVKKVNAAYATPKLIVTGSTISKKKIKAGDPFKLTLNLKNESTSTKLTNISLKIASAENEIMTVSGTDTIYVDEIDKNAKRKIHVKLKTRKDLAQRGYPLSINYNYEDNSRNSFEGNATITIPISQKPKISLSEKKTSRDTVTVGGKTNVSFKVNNIGKDTTYNLNVDFKGNTIKDISTFVGNMEVGESKAVDLALTSEKTGDSPIIAKIRYEDAEGNQFEKEETFNLAVEEEAIETADSGKNGKSVNAPVVGAGIGSVVVLFLIISVLIRKKKEAKYA